MRSETQSNTPITSTRERSWREELTADYELSQARLEMELSDDVEEHL